MKEKNIFLMGLGTGLVITSIISLFLYNILKSDIISNDINTSTTITTTEIELFNKNPEISENSQTIIDSTTETTTIDKLKLSETPNLEITTDKPFELKTN